MTNQSSQKKRILTPEGYKSLLKEYKDLTEIQRPNIVKEISKAREMGDLRENGMYQAAREKQSFLEGRIREIEAILKNVDVVKKAKGKSKTAEIGSKVIIQTPEGEVEYHIVGEDEVDMETKKISHESPLGEAILGKKEGDTVEFSTPSGKMTYKIISIK